jgi:hypothetical protein
MNFDPGVLTIQPANDTPLCWFVPRFMLLRIVDIMSRTIPHPHAQALSRSRHELMEHFALSRCPLGF